MDLPIYMSFVVSIYNVSQFLDDCIQSICRIENSQIEILLVDDGSTDCCPAICQKYAETDKRIHVVSQENQGVSMARNNGIELAKGKWVCFVDGDDCLADDFENRIMGQIDEDADINCFGYQRMLDGKVPEWIARESYFLTDEDMLKIQMRILNRDVYQDNGKFPDTILFEAAYTKFIKREKLPEWGLSFDKMVSWGEDLLFNFRLMQKAKRVKVIDCTGYYYRINGASITQRYDTQAAGRFRLLIEGMGAEVEKAGDEEAKRQYQVFVIKQLLQSVQRDMLNPQNPKPYRERRRDYRKLRDLEEVKNALRAFPYGYVRALYRVAILITATGSYGLLWLFYQIKRLRC